jgi:hypothetical protein
MLVLVVAKKVRDELSVFSGIELRAGIAMAGTHPFAEYNTETVLYQGMASVVS